MAKKKHKKDPKTWKIKRRREGTKHIGNCASGYFGVGTAFHQVHHILPVTCLGDGSISKAVANEAPKVKVIKNCLKLTKWDINAEPNCIGLPLKPAYHDRTAPPGWGGVPCHQVDHPPYTDEVADYLKHQVWDPIAEQAEDCPDFGTCIADTLEDASKHWRGELEGRGSRPPGPTGGTAYCWKNRSEPQMEDQWYLPFSMAAEPTKRSPPADFDRLGLDMKDYLRKIFTIMRP